MAASVYSLLFENRSGFPPELGFELLVADVVASISRRYVHAPGTPFTSFQDRTSFSSCP